MQKKAAASSLRRCVPLESSKRPNAQPRLSRRQIAAIEKELETVRAKRETVMPSEKTRLEVEEAKLKQERSNVEQKKAFSEYQLKQRVSITVGSDWKKKAATQSENKEPTSGEQMQ